MKFNQPWLACLLGALILAGVVTDRALHQVPAASADSYHAQIRAVAGEDGNGMPRVLGDWDSGKEDAVVPTGAKDLLRPNVLISRQYVNRKKNQAAGFLMVQCSDARNLAGHYPPICYPNAGYTLEATTRPWDAPVDAGVTPYYQGGTFYKFSQQTLEGARAMWVFNLMVLPDHTTSPSMSGVDSIARRRDMRYFGAAEIQIITDVGMPEADRSEAINMLLGGAQPLIEVILRSGAVK